MEKLVVQVNLYRHFAFVEEQGVEIVRPLLGLPNSPFGDDETEQTTFAYKTRWDVSDIWNEDGSPRLHAETVHLYDRGVAVEINAYEALRRHWHTFGDSAKHPNFTPLWGVDLDETTLAVRGLIMRRFNTDLRSTDMTTCAQWHTAPSVSSITYSVASLLGAQLLMAAAGINQGDIKPMNLVKYPWHGTPQPVPQNAQPQWIDFEGAIFGYEAAFQTVRHWDAKHKMIPRSEGALPADILGTLSTSYVAPESILQHEGRGVRPSLADQYSLGLSIADHVNNAYANEAETRIRGTCEQLRFTGVPAGSMMHALLAGIDNVQHTFTQAQQQRDAPIQLTMLASEAVDLMRDTTMLHFCVSRNVWCEACLVLHMQVSSLIYTPEELDEILQGTSSVHASMDMNDVTPPESCLRCQWRLGALKKSRVWELHCYTRLLISLNRARTASCLTKLHLSLPDPIEGVALFRIDETLSKQWEGRAPARGGIEFSAIAHLWRDCEVPSETETLNVGQVDCAKLVQWAHATSCSWRDVCHALAALTQRATHPPRNCTPRVGPWENVHEEQRQWEMIKQIAARGRVELFRDMDLSTQAAMTTRALSKLIRLMTHSDIKKRSDIFETVCSPSFAQLVRLGDRSMSVLPAVKCALALGHQDMGLPVDRKRNIADRAVLGPYVLHGRRSTEQEDAIVVLDEQYMLLQWRLHDANAEGASRTPLNVFLPAVASSSSSSASTVPSSPSSSQQAMHDFSTMQLDPPTVFSGSKGFHAIAYRAMLREYWAPQVHALVHGECAWQRSLMFNHDHLAALSVFAAVSAKHVWRFDADFYDQPFAHVAKEVALGTDLMRWEMAHWLNACGRLCEAAYTQKISPDMTAVPDESILYWTDGVRTFVSAQFLETADDASSLHLLRVDRDSDNWDAESSNESASDESADLDMLMDEHVDSDAMDAKSQNSVQSDRLYRRYTTRTGDTLVTASQNVVSRWFDQFLREATNYALPHDGIRAWLQTPALRLWAEAQPNDAAMMALVLYAICVRGLHLEFTARALVFSIYVYVHTSRKADILPSTLLRQILPASLPGFLETVLEDVVQCSQDPRIISMCARAHVCVDAISTNAINDIVNMRNATKTRDLRNLLLDLLAP